MNARDEKMDRFSRIAEQYQPVRLINNYRGFPISYEARIVSVSQGYVTLSIHEYQAVCMTLEGKTYLQSPLLPEVYLAAVVTVDVNTKEAVLTEFVGVGDSVGKRTYTRVQPSKSVEVEIYDGEHRIPGKLADISTSGIGVFTFATYIYGDLSIPANTKVFIDVKLPGSDSPVRFQGTILNVIRQKGEYLHRLGLKIRPSQANEALLKEYVSFRQDEIMRELSHVYDSMRQENTG